MQRQFAELNARLAEIHDLSSAKAVLEWDQWTKMPPGGAAARAVQLATLERLAHQRRIDPGLGRLIGELEPYGEGLDYESDEAALIRIARHDFDRAEKIPPDLQAEFIQHGALTYQVWEHARPRNDFLAVRPYLEKTLVLSRRIAECFHPEGSLADPLIDYHDPGLTAADVRMVLAELREGLLPLVKAIADSGIEVDDRCLRQHFPADRQLAFGLPIARAFGYDFDRGRQDLTAHPFATSFSIGDVRITTRVREDHLGEALFGTLHESGHAMYEQGIDAALERSPLGNGVSAGIHESQSRLWENLVGRSRPFWRHCYPHLQAAFPEQLGRVDLETFYQATNKVTPSLIRTDADEVTYNLHVMLRFELELDLLEGRLTIAELPDAWGERMQGYLGVTPPDDRDGVLQDVHWYDGTLGGSFQGYTLGNIMSVLFYEQAVQAHPSIPDEMGEGQFATLHHWLRENLYRHGRKFTARELLERTTGSPEINSGPYLHYLWQKFSEIYGIA